MPIKKPSRQCGITLSVRSIQYVFPSRILITIQLVQQLQDDGRGRGGDSQVMSAAPFGPSGHDVRCKRQLLALPLFLSCVLSLRSTDDGVDNVARWRWVQLGTLSVAFGRGRTGLLLLLLPWQRTRVIRPSLSFKGTGNFVTRGLFAATSTELSIL